MKFYIKLKCLYNHYSPVSLPSTEVGLKLVDTAREKSGVPKLSLDKINHYIPSYKPLSFEISISEEEARDSGLYADCHTQNILTEDAFLNEFVEVKYEISTNNETGEVIKCNPYFELNRDKVKKA